MPVFVSYSHADKASVDACRRSLFRIILAGLLVFASLSSQILFSQSSSTLSKPRDLLKGEESEFNADSLWRLTAVDITTQIDSVDSQLRAERNAYLKPILERVYRIWRPVLLKGGTVWMNSGPDVICGYAPEVPAIPNPLWVIAKFESFHVFAIDPQYRLIYTEENYRVAEVIKGSPAVLLAPGQMLDVNETGGRLKTPKGIFAFFAPKDRQDDNPLGHTFLFVGSIDQKTKYFNLDKEWDVTSGRLISEDPCDKHGPVKPKLDGLTVPEAIEYLKSIFPEAK